MAKLARVKVRRRHSVLRRLPLEITLLVVVHAFVRNRRRVRDNLSIAESKQSRKIRLTPCEPALNAIAPSFDGVQPSRFTSDSVAAPTTRGQRFLAVIFNDASAARSGRAPGAIAGDGDDD